MRILQIESDARMSYATELMLRSKDFSVQTVHSGEEGTQFARSYSYDIVLMNLDLPDMAGLDLVRTLRTLKVATPIFAISSLVGVDIRVMALARGADDFLSMPFDKDELTARIHAVIRRSKGHATSIITAGAVSLDLVEMSVQVRRQPIGLTHMQYQVLELLCLRKGTTVTRDEIMDHLYGGVNEAHIKIVDVFVSHIRRKISQANEGVHYIETVRGRGFCLKDPDLDQQESGA